MLLLILEELKELKKDLNLHICGSEDGGKFVQWAARINRVFFISYIVTVSIFLSLIYMEWTT